MKWITAEQFGHDMSGVTVKSINELIERRREKDRYQRKAVIAGLTVILLFVSGLTYIFTTKQDLLKQFSFSDFLVVLSDPFVVILGLASLVFLLRFQQMAGTYAEVDDEYESLRCELIDRSEELWFEPAQRRKREQILVFLEEQHDINLYYKN